MEYLRKFFTIRENLRAKRRVTDVRVCKVDPICISVIPKRLEDNVTEETEDCPPVQTITVEDAVALPLHQNGRSTFVDVSFGDISSFLQTSHDENKQLPFPAGQQNVEGDLPYTTRANSNSILIECPESTNLDNQEEVQAPENILSHAPKPVRFCVNKVKALGIKTQAWNTDKEYKPSVYIHTHFDMMYIFGACAYRIMSENSFIRRENQAWHKATGIKMAIFVTIVTLSTFQSFCDAKYYFLWFLAGGGLNQLVRFAFDLTNLVSCAYATHILCCKGIDINEMFQTMRIYEKDWIGKRVQPAFSFVLVVVTVILASMRALLLVDFDELSVEAVVLQSSHELSEDLFLWSSADLNITTSQLEAKFGKQLSMVTIIMGIVKIFRSFSFAMLQSMIWDIIANVVLIMMCWMAFFIDFVRSVEDNIKEQHEIDQIEPDEYKQVNIEPSQIDTELIEQNRIEPEGIEQEQIESNSNEPEENEHEEIKSGETETKEIKPNEDVSKKIQVNPNALQKQRIVAWKMYRKIRIVFAAVNEVMGPLLMLFHVKNVLRYAFFMEHVIYPEDVTSFEYIHIFYEIVKSEIIYLTATNISKQNKVIRKWLRNWALETGQIDLGYKQMDITVVLDELDEEPLGLGQGELVVHQGFHFGLLGIISSLFVMLANKTGAKF